MNALALLIALSSGPAFAEVRLPAGTVIEAEHVAGDGADSLVGRTVKRTIYPGQPLMLADTREPDLVERNGLVRIVAVYGPMRVETRGRALGAGGPGDEIRVMNLDSKRTIIGTVVGENMVEVPL